MCCTVQYSEHRLFHCRPYTPSQCRLHNHAGEVYAMLCLQTLMTVIIRGLLCSCHINPIAGNQNLNLNRLIRPQVWPPSVMVGGSEGVNE